MTAQKAVPRRVLACQTAACGSSGPAGAVQGARVRRTMLMFLCPETTFCDVACNTPSQVRVWKVETQKHAFRHSSCHYSFDLPSGIQ